jgi:serine protease Do
MLSRLVAARKPGEEVDVELLREGRAQTIEVSLAEAPGASVAAADEPGAAAGGRLGVVVRELPAAMGGERQGVVVEAVSGPAARAGIEAGDVILAVNSQAVSTAAELKALVARAPERIALLVARDDAEIYVPVSLG